MWARKTENPCTTGVEGRCWRTISEPHQETRFGSRRPSDPCSFKCIIVKGPRSIPGALREKSLFRSNGSGSRKVQSLLMRPPRQEIWTWPHTHHKSQWLVDYRRRAHCCPQKVRSTDCRTPCTRQRETRKNEATIEYHVTYFTSLSAFGRFLLTYICQLPNQADVVAVDTIFAQQVRAPPHQWIGGSLL